MKEVAFQYKCRMCGKVYDGSCCGEELAFTVLIAVLFDIDYPDLIGIKPRLMGPHLCNEKTGQHGVGDFIGYKIREEKTIMLTQPA